MADYTLQSLVQSGNAYKAGLMLELCQADWQPQWIDLFNGETRSEEFRKTNHMGEVPVLIDHTQQDVAITQSAVILMHLADRFGKFVPDNRAEELEMLRWMFFDNHKLTSQVAGYRFLKRFMKKEGDPETEYVKGRAMSALKVLDDHLTSHDWIAAGQPTLADISTCGYLFWPDHIDVTWDDYPGIKPWLNRIQTLPHWAAPEDILPSAATN